MATSSLHLCVPRSRKSAPLSQRTVEVLYLAAVRTKKSKYRQRAAVSVATGETAHSPIIRGVSVKFPRTAAMSASKLALSASEPHVVLPQAWKTKSSISVSQSVRHLRKEGSNQEDYRDVTYKASNNDTVSPTDS
jgi:hypothetical protein